MVAPVPAKTLAQTLKTELGQDFVLPNVDLTQPEFQIPSGTGNPLYAAIAALSVADLTTGIVGGTGAFDKLMASHKAHLQEQYEKGRITGDQYTKAYIELTTTAMTAAVQFLLAKDQNHWQAVLVQLQAQKAEVELVTTKVQLETAKQQLAAAKAQAEILEAQYVLALLQLPNEVAKYDLAYTQLDLVKEQIEAARGQTLDTRTDGLTAIAGMLGKQKDLYTQQIDSYIKDAKYKVAKIYSDGWITQKTVDEGLTPPTELTNATIQTVLNRIRLDNNLT